MATPSIDRGYVTPCSKKRWQHRTVEPDVTLGRLAPVLETVGITRVADLTGLDRIGIPVFQAVRPLGRLLSVSQGKGITAAAAKASAVMEATEIWHAENLTLDCLRSTRAQIRDIAHIDPSPYVRPGFTGKINGEELVWASSRDLETGATVLVPRDIADLDFTRPAEPPWLMRNTNGLAGGNTEAEALSSALAEVIERACRAAYWRLDNPGRAARRLDPELVASDSAAIAGLVEAVIGADLNLDLFDLTNSLEVTTIRAVIYDCSAHRPTQRPAEGHGTHLDPVTAVVRALTEAAQARITYISGNRDDLDPGHFGTWNLSNLSLAVDRQMDFAAGRRGLDLTDQSGETPESDVSLLMERVVDAGLGPVLALDLSHAAIGIPVVKVIAPRLQARPAPPQEARRETH
ncbi:MAG: YcaO-like family protein [Pseudomonadota bacterium]